jgi:acyl-coenzyme A thioesterase PaaI-like protein
LNKRAVFGYNCFIRLSARLAQRICLKEQTMIPTDQPIQNFYPDPAICFGCGRNNAHGLHIQSYWLGDGAVAHFMPQPHHSGYPGMVYGGLIASLIDCHSIATATAAIYELEGRPPGEPYITCVTGTLTVTYLKPTPLGTLLTVRSAVQKISASKATVVSSLLADDVECAKGEVIAVRLRGG